MHKALMGGGGGPGARPWFDLKLQRMCGIMGVNREDETVWDLGLGRLKVTGENKGAVK